MRSFDKNILETMTQIGFNFYQKLEVTHGTLFEYKYYPKYFNDRHFTLILFEGNVVDIHFEKITDEKIIDHRLYIHNSDGSFNASAYQINSHSEWNKKLIIKKINDIFVSEIRNQKLTNLLYDK